ncbi:unnamed protein product [Miscanthus lutarioriparius]|uniref:NB-ARC domain-containing protein n=1 Tax=Miscanthus lutarioriparius TaxID=422564 RepID=A0A811NEA1_9POAL|nr:unnamed protein product [Miscanthus lutarioriparius]
MESQLVGQEKEKPDLDNLISKQDEPMVISVWGMGGLGKTTLVKEVYESQELSGLFEKRACVTIMRPFILSDVLDSLCMQLDPEYYNKKGNDFGLGRRKITENEATIEELGMLGRKLTAEALIKKLDSLLKGKRCLIVLDDLSSLGEWGMIIRSLPVMNSMCQIVITTREENIARHCSQKQENIYKLQFLEDKDALDLFTKMVLIQWLLKLVVVSTYHRRVILKSDMIPTYDRWFVANRGHNLDYHYRSSPARVKTDDDGRPTTSGHNLDYHYRLSPTRVKWAMMALST